MSAEAWRGLTATEKAAMERLTEVINGHHRTVAKKRATRAETATARAIRTRVATRHDPFNPPFRSLLSQHLVVAEMPVPEDLLTIYRELRNDPAFNYLKRQANFVGGDGPHPSPQAVLLGEAPGATEDKVGRPFVGKSGNFLDSMLGYAGLKRSACYVTNVVKWRPPDNRAPTKEEVEAAVPYLRREIMTVLPRGGLIILLGSTALDVVDQARRVSKVHGQAFPKGIWTFAPMYHPSYIMQNRAPREVYVNDWRAVEKYVIK